MNFRWLEQIQETTRYQSLMRLAHGDIHRASELHAWNGQLSGALLADIGALEVVLRASYSRNLNLLVPQASHWILELDRIFPQVHSQVTWSPGNQERLRGFRRAVANAREQATRFQLSHDQAYEKLSLGFWRALTSAWLHEQLWMPALRHAYAPGTSRAWVHHRMVRIHWLRNCVAHHDLLLEVDVGRRHDDLCELATALCPDLGSYLVQTSAVPNLLVMGRQLVSR
jgi:hypothetical protein